MLLEVPENSRLEDVTGPFPSVSGERPEVVLRLPSGEVLTAFRSFQRFAPEETVLFELGIHRLVDEAD
jgi:hypothetical protein